MKQLLVYHSTRTVDHEASNEYAFNQHNTAVIIGTTVKIVEFLSLCCTKLYCLINICDNRTKISTEFYGP